MNEKRELYKEYNVLKQKIYTFEKEVREKFQDLIIGISCQLKDIDTAMSDAFTHINLELEQSYLKVKERASGYTICDRCGEDKGKAVYYAWKCSCGLSGYFCAECLDFYNDKCECGRELEVEKDERK